MNNAVVVNVFRFIALLLLQFFVMEQVRFMGFINPMIYILFIILYPVYQKQWDLLLLSFGLGILVDTFQDSGGVHAAAAITLAFARPLLLRLVYGESYRTRTIKVMDSPLDRIALLIGLSVAIHHIVYFSLIIFNVIQFVEIMKLTLFTGIATFFTCFVLTVIFTKKQRL